ncbi:Axl2p [Sugiyamaella lignohabitans]|uniref:Axl2p n=1 Tax=Sugiyamaella lignohabitans TaxID=796027 RepID=A0A167DBR4_9ASCO|nr:Axl2p [Sugiyamaella lignohabitans]ANB12726.1 Axl2p [Sugiyamaella lignohabitans]
MSLSFLGLLALSSLAVSAAPNPSYPFNAQLPPVARYGQAYQYQIPSDTFVTPDGSLNYSASGLPSWLAFDDSTRTLSGTPPSSSSSQGDQMLSFTLTGTDASGSTNSTCQLQLSAASEPQLSNADVLDTVLTKSGPLADGSSVVVKPGQPFNIQFPQPLYQDSRQVISYNALTSSHSPLPIWMNFDASTLTFSGTAPSINSQIAPAEEFGVALILTDYSGFASAEIDFQLLIGAHQFAIDFVSQEVNTTVGKPFQYEIPLSNITLDGQGLTGLQNISSVSINSNSSNSWISLDSSNGTLSGTAPSDSAGKSYTISVTMNDLFDDSVTYELIVSVQGADGEQIFSSSSLNPVNATRGQFFKYDVSSFLLDKNATLSVTQDPKTSWLNFNSDNNTFTGMVPDSFNETTVTLKASNDKNLQKRASETASFTINGVDEKKPVHSSSTSASSTSTPTASATASSSTAASTTAASAAPHSGGVSNKTIAILCGVIIPVCVLLALLILFLCCRRRTRSNADGRSPSPKLQISDPILPESDIEKNPGDLVYPVKSITSGTTAGVHTPEMGKGGKLNETEIAPTGLRNITNNNEWEDSPQRASTFNFLRIDGGREDDDEEDIQDANHINNTSTSSGETHIGDRSFSNASAEHASQPFVGQALTLPGDDSVQQRPNSEVEGRPRNSWRQTNTSDKRWQEHQSLGSLATISTDELLTVRLVDRDSGISSSQRDSRPDSFMDPTKSRILTPHHSFMPSDGSSTILKPIGSHSSTLQGHSQSNSIAYSERDTEPAPPMPNLDSLQEEQVRSTSGASRRPYNPKDGTTSFYGLDSESMSTDYRTASSGDDYDEEEDEDEAHSSEGEVIRPYRNSQGELKWNQVPRDESSDFVSMASEDEYSDNNTEVLDGPSRYSASTARTSSRRDTGGKLVDFTKKGESNHNPPVNDNSLSGELAFL